MADTIPCPACGTDNSPDAVRCHVCDYELRAQLPVPTGGPEKCPRCGSGITPGATFCQVCGQAVEQRFARPHTGALNVRALFGDEGDVPTRTPIREHTEIAPSAHDPHAASSPRFAPPGGQARRSPPVASPVVSSPPEREHSAPRGRRRPAPRPQPTYAGFDASDSSHGDQEAPPPPGAPSPAHQVQAQAQGGAPYVREREPVYASSPASPHAAPRPQGADPSASANNLPRPRAHDRAHAAPVVAAQAPTSQPGHGGYQEAAAIASAQHHGGQPPVQSWGSPQSAATLLRLVLVGRDGREGDSFPLPAQGVEIGRQGPIAFPSDPFVSPQHAKITPIEGGVHIADLSSRNGVYLRLTEPTPVYPGDCFLLGNQLLRLDRLDSPWQEQPLDRDQVRGFGTPVKPPWAVLVRVCVGELEDDRYHLRGTEMTIGREQGEVVFPSDGFLSRAHARVRMEVADNAMTVMLEDLGSANGTYLRIRGAVNVPHGAMFRVGDQIFRVRHD